MNSKILDQKKVLVVDDDSMGAELLSRILTSKGAIAKICTQPTKAEAIVTDFAPDLVVLDYNMPAIGGVELLKKLRKHKHYTTVVFLSGEQQPSAMVDAFAAGADDFVAKPYHMETLIARLAARIKSKEDKDELLRANEKLQQLAESDDVTGLYNMRYMYEKIDNELKRSNRYRRNLTVVMLDIDHFKRVNDNHDHLFGSHVLKEIGKIILDNLRHGIDFAARYGGDEFLIVLPETDFEGGHCFADRLRETLQKHVFTDGRNEFRLTTSLGFATLDPPQKIRAEQLVLKADLALYNAKESGRNKAVGHTDEIQKAS